MAVCDVAERPQGARYSPTERELFRRAHAGDRRARDDLAARYMGLARSLALRYRRASEALDDLVQVASVGLIKAIDRYDPSRGVAFSSYAVPTIAGEIKRYFRDYSWAVRPPRDLQELTLRIDRVVSELTAHLDRAPTTAELSEVAGVGEEMLMEALQARSARGAISLQAPCGEDGCTVEERIGTDDGGIATAEKHAMLDVLLTNLSAREREIVRLRFDEDKTQAEIGAVIGISQMQVSRIIRQALQHLRDASDDEQRMVVSVGAGLAG